MFARRRFKQAVRRHVTVHLQGELSIDGVLAGIYADGVQLDAARYLRTDDYDVPLEGVQLIPWSSILWVQELSDARAGAPVE